MTQPEMVNQLWWALSCGKTDRYDTFRRILAAEPTDQTVIDICYDGIAACHEGLNIEGRTAAIVRLLRHLGETVEDQ